MTNRQLAEKIVEYCVENCTWEPAMGAQNIDDIEDALSTIPLGDREHVPDGAVKVRVAVSRCPRPSGSGEWVFTEAIDSAAAEQSAVMNVRDADSGITHLGILEAWLPPIAPPPTVPATALQAGEGA